MQAGDALPPEANLSGRAAKLLIHLIRRNGKTTTNAELMRGSGVTDPGTFFRAKKELRELGYLQNPIGIFQGVGETLSAFSKYCAESNQQNPSTREMPTGEIPRETPFRGVMLAEVIHPEPTQPKPEAPLLNVPQFTEESDWRAEAMQADLMDSGGDEHQRGSAFQARRNAQIEVLQGAWKALFGKDLVRDGAKRMLSFSGDSAEDVYDVMELAKARNIEHANAYVEKVLKSRRDEARTAAQSVRPVSIDKPGAEESAGDDNYYRPPSPEYLRKMEKLRAAGLLQEEDDD